MDRLLKRAWYSGAFVGVCATLSLVTLAWAAWKVLT